MKKKKMNKKNTKKIMFLNFKKKEWEKISKYKENRTEYKKMIKIIQNKKLKIEDNNIDSYFLILKLLTLNFNNYLNINKKIKKITKNKNSTPYIIGITGSVASGKTTLAQTIKIFLKKYLKKKITNISTDNFLYSNKKLEKKKITHKKGFPESYNFKNLMKFLQKVKLKKEKIKIPKYSHLNYDIIKNKHIKINKTDILILEGLNILQIKSYQQQKNKQKKILSDLINFSIYVHAPEKFLKKWYKDRLLNLYKNRNQYKECFLKKFNNLTKKELFNQLTLIWNTINKLNLTKNILPTKERATLILNKTYNHKINKIKYKI